jgi:cytochrome P450
MWQKLPFPHMRRFRRSLDSLEAMVTRLIAEHHAELDRGDQEHAGDLLSILLMARDVEGDGGGMSDAQLRDEVMTIFIAGHETIANALSWSWYLLAQNPEAEARLHAEIDGVLAGRLPTTDDMSNLTYTRAVLSEAMRLYPPGWAASRRAVNDCHIGGYFVPRGAEVAVSQWVMHRDARYFPEPLRFLPERWLDDSQSARPKFAYFPFGGGARFCIGEGFAWMEGVLTLATVAQQWRFKPTEQRVGTQPVLTLRPRNGLKMKAQRRK